MPAHPVAVLDANVLMPPGLRDVLLSCADVGMFRPVWQSVIDDEVLRNGPRVLVRSRGLDQPQALQATQHALKQMNAAFPDARLAPQAWKRHVVAMTNDEKDRHVLAAAVGARATHVVTVNLRDFPVASRPPGVRVLHPDGFLLEQLKAGPEMARRAMRKQAARLRAPAMTAEELAARLAGDIRPRFGAAVLEALGRSSSPPGSA